MKKYLAGLLTGLLSVVVITTALAATDLVSFNLSPIAFNGEIISAAGEGYTLSNGCVAPASITYTDEQGGGTTYLPARRVSELLDVDIGWDPASGAVTIGKVEQPATPDTTTNSGVNVFSYTPENTDEEYDKFLQLWDMQLTTSNEWLLLEAKNSETAYSWWEDVGGNVEALRYFERFADDIAKQFDNNPPAITVLMQRAPIKVEWDFRPYGVIAILK